MEVYHGEEWLFNFDCSRVGEENSVETKSMSNNGALLFFNAVF